MNRQGEGAVALTVVVPAHNSGALIEQTVATLAKRLAGSFAEIIVVENGSTDGTHERCLRLLEAWTDSSVTITVLQSAPGMGCALRTGAMASHGASVLLTADDLPFGFDDLDAADQLTGSNGVRPPLIIGSKAHPDSRVPRARVRQLMTWGYLKLRRWILAMRTGDPQGTLIVQGDLLRHIVPRIVERGYLFTTELVYVLEQMGVRPVEVPVALRDSHRTHGSRVRTSDAIGMALGLVRVRRRHAGKCVPYERVDEVARPA